MKVRKILSWVMFGLACGLIMTNMVSASATITPIAPPANAGSTRFWIQFDDGNGHVIKMLNRNLWTNVAWTWEDSYGYYYQRWNNNWFSIQNGTNSIPLYEVSELEYNMWANLVQWNSSYDANWYNGSTFIKSIWEPFWWDYWKDGNNHSANHQNLWWWEWDYDNSWWLTSTNDVIWRQWPCPRWYHIPSQWEWNELFKHWWMANSWAYDNYDSMTYYEDDYGSYLNLKNSNKNDDIVQDFMDDFRLTFDGYHDWEDWTLKLQWKIWYYWTSSPNTVSEALSRKFIIMPSGIYDDASGIFSNSDSARAYGYSVRCFYDPNPAKYYAYFYDNWSLIGSWSFIEWETPEWEIPTLSDIDGYIFNWWRDDSYNQYTNLTMTTVENVIKYSDIWMQNYNPTDKNFYTVRSPISYNISYNINGWTHSNPSSYTIEDYIVLNNPTRIWYTFIWWSGTDIIWTSQSVIIYGSTWNRNYEANWEINTYTLTLDLWDWRTQIITWHYGDPVIQPQDPTRDWYSFAGWDTTIPTTMPAENQTITAQWTKNQTSTNHWWGWWGGWSSLKKDNCPNGDYSDSYYDGTCWMPENYAENNWEWMENNWEWNAENSGEWDYVEEQIDAYTRAYKNWITTMDTIGKANLDWNLTRIAMAKMLSYYATNVLWMKPDETRVNKFNDVSNNLDTQYDNWVTLAYQLWIMWINMPNNEFRPFDLVPRSEFVTALSRMKYWTSDGEYEWIVEFYKNHMELLNKLWIITVTDPEMLELRWYVMLMLMRSEK